MGPTDALIQLTRHIAERCGRTEDYIVELEGECASMTPDAIMRTARRMVEELSPPDQPPPLLPAHVRLTPRIFPDGDQWCMLYGDNLQDGVSGFGKTPAEAAADFDHNWGNQLLPRRTT